MELKKTQIRMVELKKTKIQMVELKKAQIQMAELKETNTNTRLGSHPGMLGTLLLSDSHPADGDEDMEDMEDEDMEYRQEFCDEDMEYRQNFFQRENYQNCDVRTVCTLLIIQVLHKFQNSICF